MATAPLLRKLTVRFALVETESGWVLQQEGKHIRGMGLVAKGKSSRHEQAFDAFSADSLSRRSHFTHSSLPPIESAIILVPVERRNLSMWKFCCFQIGSGLVGQHPVCYGLMQGSKEGNGQRRVNERIETSGAKFMGAAVTPPLLSSPRASRPSM